MRNFLLFLFFSVNLFCQKLDSSDFLILEGENPNYYYVLTNYGYYVSENSKNFIFKNYSESLPRSLNVNFNTLLPVTHKSKNYLLYPGGGLLYLFENGAIKRVDRSFPHRNQYGAYFFSYKDNLYLIGGYGFWQTKSIITKFNFNSGDWEIVTAFGQSPDGIDQGTFFVKNDNLYVFDFLTRNSNNQKVKRNDNLYVLNLESFVWKKLGVTNPLIRFENQFKGAKRFFKFDDKLLFSYIDDPEFYLADFENNTLKKFKDEILFYKSGGHSVVKKDNLVGAVRNSLTGDITVESFNIASLISNDTGNKLYLYRDTDEFYNYVYFALSFLVILIIILSIYYKKVARNYLLDDTTISTSGLYTDISEKEQKILSLFSMKKNVSNSEIMKLFLEKGKTKDFAVKKKNKTLNDLNKKLYALFKIQFINKKKSKSDSRQLTYFLNNKIRIIKENVNY